MLGACSTSSGGGPSKDAPWVGNTYVLTIPSANWTQPPNIGSDIGAFVPQFLIGIGQSSGNTMTVTIGAAENGVQDPCNVTTQVTADGSGYPNATITADALPLRIVNPVSGVVVDATVRNFTLTNVLPGAPKSGTLSAILDISELYPLFNQVPVQSRTPVGVCGLLQMEANTPCVACPTTNQPYCLTLEGVQLVAVEGTAAIMSIASSDVPASCSPSDAGGGTPSEEAGAPGEAGSMQPTDDAAASVDATASVDAAVSDAGTNVRHDAETATDAALDNQ
jgi:hypothetical protein